MKVRSAHCVEFIPSGDELARALGRPEARLKEAEVKLDAAGCRPSVFT